MSEVRIKGGNQCWTAKDKSHTGMAVSVNSAFMPFGPAKESLKLEIIARQCWVIASDEKALFK